MTATNSFAEQFGATRGTNIAPRTHNFNAGGKADARAEIVEASATVRLCLSDGKLFYELPLQSLCKALCVTDTAQIVNQGTEQFLNVTAASLPGFQRWAALQARDFAHVTQSPVRDELLKFSAAVARIMPEVAEARKEREQALARASELEAELAQAAEKLRGCMDETAPLPRILCDMCGSTTRTRCGRQGCA